MSHDQKPESKAAKPNPMTPEDASRIQSATAKQHEGKVSKDNFAARAQRAAEQNKPKP